MKRIYKMLVLSLLTLGGYNANAQAGAYTFAASSGTFTPITGGTDVNSIEADDAVSPSIPIGFTFNFDGIDYTDVVVCSNGFISFATGASSTTGNDLDNGAASRRPLLAPLWDDLDGRATGGVSQASYVVTGTAPNRVFTFEFLNWEWRYASSDPVISFQVNLHETSNVVEYIYRGESGTPSSPTASIGLSGVSSFLSLDGTGASPTASNTTESSSLSSKPADGQIYSFTPPACVGASGLNVANLSDTSATLGWTSPSAPNSNVEFGPAGFTPGTGHLIMNAFNPITIDTLSPNTAYDFYVQDSCGASDVADWVGPFTFNTPCGAYAIPWNEGFEGIASAGDFPDCVSETGDFSTGTSSQSYGRDPRTGSNYLYTNYGADDWFFTVPVELTAGQLYEFSSWMVNDNYDDWNVSLHVGSGQNAASVTDTLSIYNAIQSTSYTKLLGYYEAPSTGVYYFSIHVEANFSPWYITFDDLKIDLAPTCPVPNGLTSIYANADSVVLNWNAGYQESMWNIEYGEVGYTQGTGNLVSGVTSTTDTIDGLTLGGVYDFYVQADCGGGDASDWIGPFSFATPIINDTTCDAIFIAPNTDYSARVFSNIGATLQANESSVLPGTQNNTVWFKTVIPASGHLLIATCGSPNNTEVGAYANDTIICDSMETFGQMAYASAYTSSTYAACDAYGNGSVYICGETPGDTVLFYVGSSTEGLINLTVTDVSLVGYAGEGPQEPVSACAGDTIDLWSNLSNQLTNLGEWEYPSNSAVIVDDTTANTGAFSLVGNEVYYIVDNTCDADTAIVVVNAATQTNTGIAVSNFQACSNGDVYLFEGLTGSVDAGGIWNDDTNTGLLNGNKFVANGLPDGAYQFTYTVDNNICPSASTQITVNLVDCTNIFEEESTTFGVYPNPNDGIFFISNGKKESNIVMEVVDIQGKVIYSNTYVMAAGAQQEVSLGNVEAGVYLVRVITNNQVFNTNVVVK